MEEIKVGEYVRSDNGIILKYEYLKKYEDEILFGQKGKSWSFEDEEEFEDFIQERIVKHSPNIIDLIEEGDIAVMNCYGLKVKKIITRDDIIALKMGDYELLEILTKEQFNQMKYIVGAEQ